MLDNKTVKMNVRMFLLESSSPRREIINQNLNANILNSQFKIFVNMAKKRFLSDGIPIVSRKLSKGRSFKSHTNRLLSRYCKSKVELFILASEI